MNKDLKEKFGFTLAEGATHVGIFHNIGETFHRLVESFTHVGIFNNNRKCAFTLAEVLITLGIIGIVAAMTIPTLIKNYQEKARDNQFKKVYATLNQAMKFTVSELGYVPKCYISKSSGVAINECTLFYNTLTKYLKINKYCQNKAFENGCIPHYDGIEVVLKDKHKNDTDYDETYWDDYATRNLLGWRTEYIKNLSPAYVLSDSSILILYRVPTRMFLVDVNGFAGPNKMQHDVFEFILFLDNNNTLKIIGGANFGVNGGIMTQSLIKKLFGTREFYY